MESSSWTGQISLPSNTDQRAKKSASASPVAQRRRPPVPQWNSEIKEETQPPSRPPTDLSLIEEEPTPNPLSSDKRSKRTSAASPLESADQLYEYFPLSLDDWMPPVDAIYRPHVVHHLRVPADMKAQQVRAKPKRYFSADD